MYYKVPCKQVMGLLEIQKQGELSATAEVSVLQKLPQKPAVSQVRAEARLARCLFAPQLGQQSFVPPFRCVESLLPATARFSDSGPSLSRTVL